MAVIKTIKFDLPIDGVKVKSLEELREHFTVEILELYNNGMLLKWMRSRKILEEISLLEKKASMGLSRMMLMKTLCEVFEVEADDMIIAAALGMPPEKMEKNFPEIKAQYRAIAAYEEEKKPTVSGKYLIYKNGTVTDTETKLMWKQDSEAVKYKWDDARALFGKNAHFAGYTDWRLPTKEELESLVDKKHSPTIDQIAFPYTSSAAFWSSSPVAAAYRSHAWSVGFGNGNDDWSDKTNAFQVRLVRSGQ